MARRRGVNSKPTASVTCRAYWTPPRYGRPRRRRRPRLAPSTRTTAHSWRSQGSLVPVADHPAFASLIAHPGFQEMFRRLGLPGHALLLGLHHQQAAGRARALLASGLVGLAASDLAGGAHRPVGTLPLHDRHDAGERLPAPDPRLPSQAASAARPRGRPRPDARRGAQPRTTTPSPRTRTRSTCRWRRAMSSWSTRG